MRFNTYFLLALCIVSQLRAQDVCDLSDLVSDMDDLVSDLDGWDADESTTIKGIQASEVEKKCNGTTEWTANETSTVVVGENFTQTQFEALFQTLKKVTKLNLLVNYNDNLTNLEFPLLETISASPYASFNFTDCPYVKNITFADTFKDKDLRIFINEMSELSNETIAHLNERVTLEQLDAEPVSEETHEEHEEEVKKGMFDDYMELLVAGCIFVFSFVAGLMVLYVVQKKD